MQGKLDGDMHKINQTRCGERTRGRGVGHKAALFS